MIKRLLCTLFIILIAFIVNIFVSIGMFTNFEKVGNHKCSLVTDKEPAVGPEDITRFSKEIMLLSSDYKLELFEGDYPQYSIIDFYLYLSLKLYSTDKIKTGAIFAYYIKSNVLERL